MIYMLLLFSITGNEVLTKVDSVMNAPKDREAKLITIVIDSKGKKKERETLLYQKGDRKLIRFLSPASDRGIGFLSLSEDQMYIYMPAFNRIRRIASHVKKQSFMDTDFSYDELGSSSYKEDWDAVIEKEDSSTFYLKLTPKPGNDSDYDMIKMIVKKPHFLIEKIEFYKKGTLKKVLTMENYKKINGFWTATTIKMVNVSNNHQTIMKMKNIKFNQGLQDDIFSKRNLKRY